MSKELVEYVVKKIVSEPDRVTVVTRDGDSAAIEISVAEADRGKLIGRQGSTIKSIRALVNALSPAGKRITVDIAQ